jgi:hypothetical protein
VNGQPCYFFHFSGLDPEDLESVSKHQNRFHLGDIGEAATLFRRYAEKVLANGHREVRGWPYAFGTFSNGERITEITRRMYWEMGDGVERFGDPFIAGLPGSFHDWLVTSIDRLPLRSRLYMRLVHPWEPVLVPRLRITLARYGSLWRVLKRLRDRVRPQAATLPPRSSVDWRPGRTSAQRGEGPPGG